MYVINPPTPVQLEHLTPSIYEASLKCLAKSVWYAFGQRGVVPENPAGILGTSFHSVLEAANRGILSPNRADARKQFDSAALSQYERAHPLLKLKFPSYQRLPYYNFRREQAVLLATHIAEMRRPSSGTIASITGNSSSTDTHTESRLCSIDGMIVGRPDYINRALHAVIDYKSGYVDRPQLEEVSDSEGRQLRLYAYLANENGIQVNRAVIVRGEGQHCEIEISSDEAYQEAFNARQQLQTLNTAIADQADFDRLASPSAENCRACPCISFCDSFWSCSEPGWNTDCGSQLEGEVQEVQSSQTQGISVSTYLIEVCRGTVGCSQVSAEQIPDSWMTLDGAELPEPGDIIRIVNGREAGNCDGRLLIKVDKILTTIWQVKSE